jgi:hypothetical protein
LATTDQRIQLSLDSDVQRPIRGRRRVSSTADDVKGLTTSFGALQALVTLHKEQFHEYQLQVARDYVTQAGVSELKRDIITELGRVEQRVEAQIDRLMETRAA